MHFLTPTPTPPPFFGSKDVYVVCWIYVALTAIIYFGKIYIVKIYSFSSILNLYLWTENDLFTGDLF